MAKVTLKERKENLAKVLEGAVKAGEISKELSQEITDIFGSSAVSTKINAEGEVYCNYFKEYLPKEDFHVSEKGKIDSMSLEGKRLNRTQKSMINKATNEVLKQFRAKDITAEEMEELLATIDENAGHRFPIGTESVTTDYPFSV